MSKRLLPSLSKLLKDPPPLFAFEISEAGIACAQLLHPPRLFFQEFEPDVLAVSPVRDNILRPEGFLAQLRVIAPVNSNKKLRPAAVLLPDYSVRLSVVDFDEFPSDHKEQATLLRFRLKRSVPFDVDSAVLSYWPQASAGGKKGKVEVVVALAPAEIVGRYEILFREAGFHPGFISTSALAALELVPPGGLKIMVKRSRRVLSIAVLQAGVLRLLRTIEIAEASLDEMLSHLFPTLAFVEDELAVKPDGMLLCGFASDFEQVRERFVKELGLPVDGLQSRYGAPGEFNAGILGYLEATEES